MTTSRPAAERTEKVSEPHTHDCTGPDMTCPCGFKLVIPRFCVSIDIFDGPRTVVSEGFNCSDAYGAIAALERAIERLTAPSSDRTKETE